MWCIACNPVTFCLGFLNTFFPSYFAWYQPASLFAQLQVLPTVTHELNGEDFSGTDEQLHDFTETQDLNVEENDLT